MLTAADRRSPDRRSGMLLTRSIRDRTRRARWRTKSFHIPRGRALQWYPRTASSYLYRAREEERRLNRVDQMMWGFTKIKEGKAETDIVKTIVMFSGKWNMVWYHTEEVKVERKLGVVSAGGPFKRCRACHCKGRIAKQRGHTIVPFVLTALDICHTTVEHTRHRSQKRVGNEPRRGIRTCTRGGRGVTEAKKAN